MKRLLAALGVTTALVGACGGDDAPRAAAPPQLPVTSVPESLEVGGGLIVQRNATKATRRAFASVGEASLAVEAGVWELRRADELVGALQVITLDNRRVDTRSDEDRSSIRSQVLSGSEVELEVAGIPVWSAADGDRVLYVWYGRQVMGVLQVRAADVDPEDAAEEMVTSIVDDPDWPGLDPEAFEEDE